VFIFSVKETEYLKAVIENKEDYPEIVEAEITDQTLRNIECSGGSERVFHI